MGAGYVNVMRTEFFMRVGKGVFAGIILLVLSAPVLACPECRAKVEGGIYTQDFAANLFVVLLPIVILTAVGGGLYYAAEIAEKVRGASSKWERKRNAAR